MIIFNCSHLARRFHKIKESISEADTAVTASSCRFISLQVAYAGLFRFAVGISPNCGVGVRAATTASRTDRKSVV